MIRRYILLFSLGALGLVSTVRGDTIHTLTETSAGGPQGSPFGTVTLHSIDAFTVQVTEVLTTGNVFAFTGAGDSLEFNVNVGVSLVANTLTSGFILAGSDSASPFGNFLNSIRCATN